jgi:hypothetical protein
MNATSAMSDAQFDLQRLIEPGASVARIVRTVVSFHGSLSMRTMLRRASEGAAVRRQNLSNSEVIWMRRSAQATSRIGTRVAEQPGAHIRRPLL